MSLHIKREIERLKIQLLQLSTLVEENLQRSIRAVESRDTFLANEVIDQDRTIDQREIEVEEECLKILALHQPVATDLRFLVAVLKMNNDLERIGDLAVNIARRANALASIDMIANTIDFQILWRPVRQMFQNCLEALVNKNVTLARDVCLQDDRVDELHRQTYEKVKKGIIETPDSIDYFIHALSISRQLERIADHATNIAEEVIYMVEGEIIRHQKDKRDQ